MSVSPGTTAFLNKETQGLHDYAASAFCGIFIRYGILSIVFGIRCETGRSETYRNGDGMIH